MITTTPRATLTRRGLLGAGAGLAAGLGLAACSPGSAGKPGQAAPATGDGGAAGYDGPAVTLAFWHGLTGGDGPIMKKLCDKFTQEHPNVKITTTAIPWADYYQKLPAAVSNGKGPDVGIMHVDNLATNAARNVVQPLDDVAKALGLTEDDFSPVVWQAGVYKDVRYGIPLDMHPAGLYWNKTVFEKAGVDPETPPTDLDSFMDVLDKAKSKNIQGFWVSPAGASWLLSQSIVFQNGGFLADPAGDRAGFGDEPAVKAITWLKSLIDQGYSPKNVAGDGDSTAFQNDKAAMMFNGPWMTTPLGENSKLKWGAAELPVLGANKGAWANSHQFVLARQIKPDENKATASRVFVNWISQQSLSWADAGMVPARKSVREQPEFQKKGYVLEFAKALDYATLTPPVPGVGDINTEWNTAVNNALLGKGDPATLLKEAAGKADKILAANKKKYA